MAVGLDCVVGELGMALVGGTYHCVADFVSVCIALLGVDASL